MKRLGGLPIRSAASAVAALAAVITLAPFAEAAPSRWARALSPSLDQQATMLSAVDDLQSRASFIRRQENDQPGMAVHERVLLERAREVLERGGAARSRDLRVRYRLAEVYHQIQDDERAIPVFEGILRSGAPDVMLAEVYSYLAISYARLARHQDEIRAYGEALAREPHNRSRATLLANRAEAYMAVGDITAAVEGYRAALSMLTSIDMIVQQQGATTLWGLGVALDRAGDLEAGIAAIRLARTYDPNDRGINGPGWFYVPPYDRFYYHALGHWSAARATDLGPGKAEEYARAVAQWEEYIASAPAEDRWLPIAKARLKQCEKERDVFLRAAQKRPR